MWQCLIYGFVVFLGVLVVLMDFTVMHKMSHKTIMERLKGRSKWTTAHVAVYAVPPGHASGVCIGVAEVSVFLCFCVHVVHNMQHGFSNLPLSSFSTVSGTPSVLLCTLQNCGLRPSAWATKAGQTSS